MMTYEEFEKEILKSDHKTLVRLAVTAIVIELGPCYVRDVLAHEMILIAEFSSNETRAACRYLTRYGILDFDVDMKLAVRKNR